ncbi:Uncharacterised protein [Klebsiella pneumoniae]|nr:Uncharacterised protein [Klebsiella pneumoniae]
MQLVSTGLLRGAGRGGERCPWRSAAGRDPGCADRGGRADGDPRRTDRSGGGGRERAAAGGEAELCHHRAAARQHRAARLTA